MKVHGYSFGFLWDAHRRDPRDLVAVTLKSDSHGTLEIVFISTCHLFCLDHLLSSRGGRGRDQEEMKREA